MGTYVGLGGVRPEDILTGGLQLRRAQQASDVVGSEWRRPDGSVLDRQLRCQRGAFQVRRFVAD